MKKNFHVILHEKTNHAKKQDHPEWDLETLAAKMTELGHPVAKGTLESWRRCDSSAPNPPIEAIAIMYRVTRDAAIIDHFCNLAGIIWHRPPDVETTDISFIRAIAKSGKEHSEMTLALVNALEDGRITDPEFDQIVKECNELIRAAWTLKELTRDALREQLLGRGAATPGGLEKER